MGPRRTFSLRDIILFLLVLLVVLGVAYKYFEWSTLKSLISISNDNLIAEISASEKSNLFFNTEAQPLLLEFADPNATLEAFIASADKLRTKISITEDIDKSYMKLLEENRNEQTTFKFGRFFLIGSARKFVTDFVENSIASYDKAIELGKINEIDNKFLDDYFLVSRDMAISNDFINKLPPNYNEATVTYVQDNFSTIGVLEKYTKDGFKFRDEDNYRTYHPYGYEILTKYRDYFKIYYSIMKDLASNDIESAGYKFSKFQSQLVAINVDFEKLFDEGTEKRNELAQSNLLFEAKIIKASKDFDVQGSREYPLLGNIGKYKGDLTLCNLYTAKIGLFNNITSEYPTTTGSHSFVKELSKVGPNTDFVDDTFDYETLRIIVNDERTVKSECRDSESGRVYTFETLK